MTAAPPQQNQLPIAQGARSGVRIALVDGSRCVVKQYNAHRGQPADKLHRELAFYGAYANVPILPELIGHQEPDTITLRHVDGVRLIDRIESQALSDQDVREVSASYGEVLAQFFAPSATAPSRKVAKSSIAATLSEIDAALKRHPAWQTAPIRADIPALRTLSDATPAMWCKTDWSASNMLVDGNKVTCLYDFDTAYVGNRLTFLGDILCGASLHLDWPAIRAALASRGVPMPEPNCLAAAAQFGRWQVQLAREAPDDLGWPGPERFGAHLEQLTRLAER